MKRHVLVLLACALVATGCAAAAEPRHDHGHRPPHGPAGSPGFNATDVMFLQMTVPHHKQGVRIAKLASTRAVRGEVRTLAAAIVSTQTAEIDDMAGWLRTWKQPTTAPADSHTEHGGMPGTSEAEIAALKKATGADFERRFLNAMIAHQDDAIQLARMETGDGVNRKARGLADRIDRSRTAQIKLMLKLLDEWWRVR